MLDKMSWKKSVQHSDATFVAKTKSTNLLDMFTVIYS